jgi:hypothetical protein
MGESTLQAEVEGYQTWRSCTGLSVGGWIRGPSTETPETNASTSHRIAQKRPRLRLNGRLLSNHDAVVAWRPWSGMQWARGLACLDAAHATK